MRANYRLPLMLVATAALGVAVITGLKAQVKPPVYVVIDISEMSDPAAFAKGVSALPPLAPGERFVIRTTKAVPFRWCSASEPVCCLCLRYGRESQSLVRVTRHYGDERDPHEDNEVACVHGGGSCQLTRML